MQSSNSEIQLQVMSGCDFRRNDQRLDVRKKHMPSDRPRLGSSGFDPGLPDVGGVVATATGA